MRSEKNVCLIKKMIKLHKDERGMSLVEVIIAITILALVAVPVLHSLTSSMVYNKKARNRQELTLTAESIMETFKGYDMDSLKVRFSPGGIGIEGVDVAVPGDAAYDSNANTGSGFHYTYSSAPLAETKGDIYTFLINDMKAENGQFYDVTITATPNSIEKVMEPVNMESTRDAVYMGDRSFDTGALQKAKEDFSNNHRSDLAEYFRDSYSDAVIKRGDDIITIKDEIDRVFETAYASEYVGNYIHLHEKRVEFQITKNGSDEYVVTPKMYYSYYMKDYPYYVRVEPDSIPHDEYDDGENPDPDADEDTEHGNVEANAIIQEGVIRYPAAGDLEVEIDLASAYPDGYLYKNPVTAGLDRLFVYYYPQYNIDEGCDKIVVKNDAGITNFQCYLLKQRAADINETQMKIKENGYKANVNIVNSAAGFELFHNFDDNIADGSSTTAPSISGIDPAKVHSYTKLAPSGDMTEVTSYFSESEVLSYKLELSVKAQDGRTITRLESSMNEKIR